jgi:hypothetical protein
MPLVPLSPTDTRPYFRPVARALVALLRGLPPDAWERPGETRFALWAGEDVGEASRVVMTDDTAWRLLFNAVPADRADALVTRTGDAALSAPLLGARSVIV